MAKKITNTTGRLDEKWMKSGSPAHVEAGIEKKLAPFADNTSEAIVARTVRNFAFEIDEALEFITTNLKGEKGDKGDQGPPVVLNMGSVTVGGQPGVTVTETSPGSGTYTVDFVFPAAGGWIVGDPDVTPGHNLGDMLIDPTDGGWVYGPWDPDMGTWTDTGFSLIGRFDAMLRDVLEPGDPPVVELSGDPATGWTFEFDLPTTPLVLVDTDAQPVGTTFPTGSLHIRTPDLTLSWWDGTQWVDEGQLAPSLIKQTTKPTTNARPATGTGSMVLVDAPGKADNGDLYRWDGTRWVKVANLLGPAPHVGTVDIATTDDVGQRGGPDVVEDPARPGTFDFTLPRARTIHFMDAPWPTPGGVATPTLPPAGTPAVLDGDLLLVTYTSAPYLDHTGQPDATRHVNLVVAYGATPTGPQPWTFLGYLSIQGAEGEQGAAGATGPMGPAVTIKGEFDPNNATGTPGQQPPATPAHGDAWIAWTPTTTGAQRGSATGQQVWGSTGGASPVNWGDLVIWDGTSWVNVGQIVGPQGPAGPDGRRGPIGPPGNPGPQGQIGPLPLFARTHTVSLAAPGATPTLTSKGNGAAGNAVAFTFTLPEANSIVDAFVEASGDLWIVLTDGTQFGPFPVVGADGADGANGTSVTDVTITNGHLVVTLEDADGVSDVLDLGNIMGPPGAAGTPGQDGLDGAPGIDGDPGYIDVWLGDGTLGDAGHLYVSTDPADGPFGANWTDLGDVTGPQGAAGAAGANGVDGADGVDGVDGTAWTVGNGRPGPGGRDGDLYLDEATGDVYIFDALEPGGSRVVANIRGATGAAGAAGARGAAGDPGSVWFPGNGAPTAGNTPGAKALDYYLDTGTGDVYLHDGTGWKAAPEGNIRGPQGAGVTVRGTADAGTTPWPPAGLVAGNMYILGATNPAGITGNPGDGIVWDGAAWQNVGQVRGPQGLQGPQGVAGPKGDKGDQGDAGTDGVDGDPGDTVYIEIGDGTDGTAGHVYTAVVPYGQPVPPFVGQGATPAGWHDTNVDITGPAGPQGLQGTAGAQGAKGDKGDKGDAGSGVTIKGTADGTTAPWPPAGLAAGDMYLLGATAPVGLTGAAGDGIVWDGTAWKNVGPVRGPAGPQGVQGVAGAAGAQGPAGAAGPAGAVGPAGPAGAKGDTGDRTYVRVGNGTNGTDGHVYVATVSATTAEPAFTGAAPAGWTDTGIDITGPDGAAGPAPRFTVDTRTGTEGDLYYTLSGTAVFPGGIGTDPAADFVRIGNIRGPAGAQGAVGPAPVFGAPAVSAVAAGNAPTISVSGTGAAGSPLILTIGVPRGADGRSITVKGAVANAAALPTTGNTDGDLYVTTNDGHGHVWDGTAWSDIGPLRGPAGTTPWLYLAPDPPPAGYTAGMLYWSTMPAAPGQGTAPTGDPTTGWAELGSAKGDDGDDGDSIEWVTAAPTVGSTYTPAAGTNFSGAIAVIGSTLYFAAAGGTWSAQSLTGPRGADGTGITVLSGAGAPTNPPMQAAIYFDTTAHALYSKPETAAGGTPSWGTGTVLNARDGVDGSTILAGAANPTAAQGKVGDYWVNTTSGTLFGPKAAGGWPAGVRLRGLDPAFTVAAAAQHGPAAVTLGAPTDDLAAGTRTFPVTVTVPNLALALTPLVHNDGSHPVAATLTGDETTGYTLELTLTPNLFTTDAAPAGMQTGDVWIRPVQPGAAHGPAAAVWA